MSKLLILSRTNFPIKLRCVFDHYCFLTTQTISHVENDNRILLANEMCVNRCNALSPANVLSTAAAQPRSLT